MTTTRIERTSIWKNTLAFREADEFQVEREKLRSAFLSLRNNTSYLVSQIATALPELTQHQIRHCNILCLFMLIALESYSQNKFFICPELSFKTSIAFVDPANMNNNEKNIFENQGFYKPYAIAYSARVVKHQFQIYGLSAGFTYKNDSRFLKFSYSKDIAGFRAYSSFRPYNYDTHSGYVANYSGIGFHRLLIDYGLKISNEAKFIQTWFTIGAGININRNRWTGIFPVSWDMQLSPNGDELLRTYIRPFEENRVNACLKIGFDHDVYLKNKYIISLNINYIQGFGIISRVEYVHEYNLNGSFVYDGTGLMSRGSGIYWGVKRRFQIYPRKTKLKSS